LKWVLEVGLEEEVERRWRGGEEEVGLEGEMKRR